MGARIKLDARGMEEAATSSQTREEIEALAERVADNVRSQGIRVDGIPGKYELPVVVRVEETSDMRINRIAARVSLAHAAGSAVQAKHGALTKAAAQAGLKVEGRS